MIYIGNLDSLSEKDYKTIANDSPDKLLLFAKKGATVPVTQLFVILETVHFWNAVILNLL